MCERLLILPMARLGDESMGALTTRIMSFVPALTASTMPVFLALVQEPLKTVVYIGVMFYLQWQLAIIILLATPFVALIIFFLGRRMKKIAGKNQQTHHALSNDIKRSGAPDADYKNTRRRHGKGKTKRRFFSLARCNVACACRYCGRPTIIANRCRYSSAIVIGYAISALEAGAMTSGDVAAFLGVMLLMPRSVRAITRSMVVFSQMQVAAREVFGFLDTPPEADNGEGLINRCRGEVSFNGITMRYATTKKAALTDVFLTIAPGETVALVGKSGAGKTTLANLLPRFYEPTSGIVRLDGEDVRSFKLADLRRQIALVTQEPLLTDDTIAANVAYPDNGNADADKVNQALQNAAADFVAELPDGVNTVIGENGGRLSGGQHQRLALARAFYRDAPIVILDEATSSLDADAEMKIKEAMRRLFRGRTAIIIAHRFTTINFADRIIVLDEGRLIAEEHNRSFASELPAL